MAVKVALKGAYALDGSPLKITWTDGTWEVSSDVVTAFCAGEDLLARIELYAGQYLKAPWGPVRADMATPEGFLVLAWPVFARGAEIEGQEPAQDGPMLVE